MNKSKLLRWGLPLVVIALGVAFSGMIRNSRPETALAVPQELPVAVRVIQVKKQSFRPTVRTQGSVGAKRRIELVSEVAGKIVGVADTFAVGGFFEEDDLLVEVDPRNYEFAVVRAAAGVEDARHKLALEQAEAVQARIDWQDLGDTSPSELVLRKPQLKSMEAKLASAKADLARAELDLVRTRITAPFAGRLEEKRVDIGQYVSLGTKLAVIYSTNIAEIVLPITDRQLGTLDMRSSSETGSNGPMDQVDVELSALVGGVRRTWTGKIVRTAGTLDPLSRVLNIIVEVAMPYRVASGGAPLINGMFVEAEIPGRAFNDVFIIPRTALADKGTVVIVDKDSRLRRRSVEILYTGQQRAVVRGLQDGDYVNISPLDAMIEGSKAKWDLVANPKEAVEGFAAGERQNP